MHHGCGLLNKVENEKPTEGTVGHWHIIHMSAKIFKTNILFQDCALLFKGLKQALVFLYTL